MIAGAAARRLSLNSGMVSSVSCAAPGSVARAVRRGSVADAALNRDRRACMVTARRTAGLEPHRAVRSRSPRGELAEGSSLTSPAAVSVDPPDADRTPSDAGVGSAVSTTCGCARSRPAARRRARSTPRRVDSAAVSAVLRGVHSTMTSVSILGGRSLSDVRLGAPHDERPDAARSPPPRRTCKLYENAGPGDLWGPDDEFE